MRLHATFAAMVLVSMVAAVPMSALAQDTEAWPNRAITLVVPYPPGGTSDIVGRQLAQRLKEELGQTVVVDNRAGAATAIGTTVVANAPKDGYTLLLSAGTTFTVNPLINKVRYKLEDFTPVAPVCTVPFAFVVRKGFPAHTVKEFQEYAKANPGKINNATNGLGSMVHLLGEQIAVGLDINMTQVHYKGASPATADMIAGIVDSNVEALTNAVPNTRAGMYRPLAVLSEQRQPLMPDVPTFKELGFPSIVGETWYGVFAPAGTPKPVVDKLSVALNRITDSAAFKESMRNIGNEAQSGSPEGLLKTTLQQRKIWGDLIRKLDIHL